MNKRNTSDSVIYVKPAIENPATHPGPAKTESMLKQLYPVGYFDTFYFEVTIEKEIRPADVLISIFKQSPAWVSALMRLRNWLVKPFGIKVDAPDVTEFRRIIENFDPGDLDKPDNEAILTMDDKHLKFYVSAIVNVLPDHKKEVSVSTLVQFHNNSGRIYFFFIRPFHKLIVPATLKRALKNLTE